MRKRLKDQLNEIQFEEGYENEVEVIEETPDSRNFFERMTDPEKYYEVIDGIPYRRGTDYLGRELYYPLADVDVEDYCKTTILFGAIGLHKFRFSSILRGLGYFFTCGFFGIGYLSDVILIFLNSVKFPDNTYLAPNYERKKMLRYIPLGLLLTVGFAVAYYFGFRAILSLMESLGGMVGNAAKENPDLLNRFISQ